jgi:hypothetical protein
LVNPSAKKQEEISDTVSTDGSDPKVEREVTSPDPSSEANSAAVPSEVIERELNRITEHLARMNSSDNKTDEEPQDSPAQESIEKSSPVVKPVSTDRDDTPPVVVDFLGTQEPKPESAKTSEGSKVRSTGSDDTKDMPTADKPNGDKPVSYGRKRPRRAVASPTAELPTEDTKTKSADANDKEVVASTSEYAVEKLEFGRGKRKRTR